jgi:hypothetical protein
LIETFNAMQSMTDDSARIDEMLNEDDDSAPLKHILCNNKLRRRVDALLAGDALRTAELRTELCDRSSRVVSLRPQVLRWNTAKFRHHWNLRPEENPTAHGQTLGRAHEIYGLDLPFPGAPRGGVALSVDKFGGLRQLMTWATRDWHERARHPKDCELRFNSALVEWYADGEEYSSARSEPTDKIELGAPTYIFSYGGKRELAFRRRSDGVERRVKVSNNTVCIVDYNISSQYFHWIPKTRRSTTCHLCIVVRCLKK